MTSRIRVVVADDSAVVRHLLAGLIRDDPRLEVAGQAADGAEAVAMAKLLHPDVMTMDIRMPRLNGLEATKKIMATAPVRILVICSVTEQSEVQLSLEATGAGALDVLPKPSGELTKDLRAWGRSVTDAIRAVAQARVVRAPASMPPPALPHVRGGIEAVGIAASTGGPPAVASILASLPADLPVPVLIAQHVAEGFASGLQKWLAQCTRLTVVTAESGFPLCAGHVYLPPDGCDLEVHARSRCALVSKSETLCSPSADRLLGSLARTYGHHGLGVVLTGMGDDGAEGLLEIRRVGGVTLAQDPASCVVYGMPRAAVAMGAVSQQVELSDIGSMIARLCTNEVGPWTAK